MFCSYAVEVTDGARHSCICPSNEPLARTSIFTFFFILNNHIINVGCDDGGCRIAEVVANHFWYPPHLGILAVKPQVAIIQPMCSYYVRSLSIHTILSFCTDVIVFVTSAEPSSTTCVRCLSYPPPATTCRYPDRSAVSYWFCVFNIYHTLPLLSCQYVLRLAMLAYNGTGMAQRMNAYLIVHTLYNMATITDQLDFFITQLMICHLV